MMSASIISVLEKYRAELQQCILKPIEIAAYREDLVRDLSTLRCCGDHKLQLPDVAKELRELKETQTKVRVVGLALLCSYNLLTSLCTACRARESMCGSQGLSQQNGVFHQSKRD